MNCRDVLSRLPEIVLDDSGKVSLAKIGVILLVGLIFILGLSYTIMGIISFSRTGRIPEWPVALAATITAIVGGISALYTANKFSKTIPFLIPKHDDQEGQG